MLEMGGILLRRELNLEQDSCREVSCWNWHVYQVFIILLDGLCRSIPKRTNLILANASEF